MLDERAFRLHIKRMFEKFTKDVVDAAQRELTVETANRIKSISDITLNLIKPEIIRFLSKFNAQIDKHLGIPADLAIDDEKCLQNTPIMDDLELQCKKDIAESELVYKQQALMIKYLRAELDLYETELTPQAEIDMGMCDLFEENFSDFSNSSSSNSMDNTVTSVLDQLSSVGIDLN